MANRLETAIQQHRAALHAIDRAAMAEVFSSYQDVMDRIEPLIELVEQGASAEGIETAPQLFRLDRYQELQRQVLVEMDKLATATADATQRAQVAAIQETIGATRSMAIASARGGPGTARISTGWVRLPTAALEDLIGATSSGPLRELLDSLGDSTSGAITNELINGLATGLGPRKIADALARAMLIPRNRALTIARTETFRAQRSAAQRVFAANADILKGWYWMSAHQTRTCAACLAKDGTLHPVSEKLNGHPNCRCAMRPALKDIPERPIESGEEWLRSQAPKDQDAVLGKKGGDAWRAGDVELSDFVRVDHSDDWGPSTRDGGIGWARKNAMMRGQPQTTLRSPDTGPVVVSRAPETPATGSSVKPPATIAIEQTATPIEIPKAAPVKPTPTAKTAPLPTTQDINPEYTMDDVFDGNPILDYRGSKTTTANGLTDAELSAIRDYSGEGYDAINGALRSGRPLLSTRGIDVIDAAMARSELHEAATVYRGVKIDVFGNLSKAVGTTYTDAGYVSTTTTRAIAESFASGGTMGDGPGVLMRIILPKGTNAVDVNAINRKSIEREILLPRGSSFRVVSVNTESSPPIVDLEVIE